MLAKLALRNVRRQTSSYIIYFITVVFTVAMMFAANNILFNKELISLTVMPEQNVDFSVVVYLVSGLVVLTVGFIICYATAFLLRKRKKELGTYMLLGIKSSSVLMIFVIENLMIGVFSFIVGCLLGYGVFWILNSIVCALMGHGFGPLQFLPESIMITLAEWAVIIFAAIWYSARILRKTKINDLLKEVSGSRKLPKHPETEKKIFVFTGIAVIVLSIIIIFLLQFTFSGGISVASVTTIIVFVLVLLAVIFCFSFFMRGSYVSGLNGPKKYDGSNVFYYRQMSSSLGRNSVIMGIIAVLLSVAFIFTNMSFAMRQAQVQSIEDDYPFDVIGSWNPVWHDYYDENTPYETIEEAKKYSEVTFSHVYDVYGDKENYYGQVIKQSDFNVLSQALNKQTCDLANDECYVLMPSLNSSISQYSSYYNYGYTVNVLGKELKYAGARPEFSALWARGNVQGFVVSDGLFTAEEWEEHYSSTNLMMNTKDYLPAAFIYEHARKNGNHYGDIDNKYLQFDLINEDYALAIVSVLFVGITFMFIAMALLSLKVMSDADLDKKRYKILGLLGVSEKGQRKILFRQLFSFFSAPMIMPFLMSIPSAIISAMWVFSYLHYVPAAIYLIGISIPLIYLGIYGCYFAATYYLSVRNNIKSIEKPKIKLLK